MTQIENNNTLKFITNFISLFNKSRFLLLILSFLTILASVMIRPIVINGWETLSYFLSYIFPFIIFISFLVMAAISKGELENEIRNEDEITRIIDKYEGIVDGIGTALPLIGAGLILYFISQIEPGHKFAKTPDPNQQRFLNIGAPFEVKSIFILAAAKLFEPIFDSLARECQKIGNRDMPETGILQAFLNSDGLNDKLDKIQETSKSLNETLSTLKDEKVEKGLDNLVKLSEKLK